MTNSLDRYNKYAASNTNLYAVIVPAGGGKTSLCEYKGYLDVDAIAGSHAIYNKIISERRQALNNCAPNPSSNSRWFELMRETLDRFKRPEPVIVLVHSEETAAEIGARICGAFLPTKKLHAEGKKDRTQIGRLLCDDTYDTIQHCTRSVEVAKYKSWGELDFFTAYVSWQHVPVPAPLEFAPRRFDWSEETFYGYDRSVPEWVLRGERRTVEGLGAVKALWTKGLVPNCCFAFYSKHVAGVVPQSVNSAFQQREWLELMARMTDASNKGFVPFDTIRGQDYFETYPHKDKKGAACAQIGLKDLMTFSNARDHPMVRHVMEHRVGDPHNLVSGIIMWIFGVASHLRTEVQDLIMSSQMLLVRSQDWVRVHKELHKLVRSCGSFFGLPLTMRERTALMYTYMLYGRELYELNVNDEVMKRQRELDGEKKSFDGSGWTVTQYDNDIEAGIKDAYSRLKESVPPDRVTSFLDFWEKRRDWAAKGSTVRTDTSKKVMFGITVDDAVEFIRSRHNKKSLFECASEEPQLISEVLDVGRNDTNAVPKYECGAERVLLPGNLAHYVVFSYLLHIFEAAGAVGAVRLNTDRDGSIKAFDHKLEESDCDRFAYDFADFNAQHSNKDMALAVSLLEECTPYDATLAWCIAWVSESFSRMELYYKDSFIRLKSGLFSGWRGTTWINSVLNHAYMYVARCCHLRLYGSEGFTFFEGTGDDVDCTTEGLAAAGRLYAITQEIGLESNLGKQLFGDTGEFLRVTYEDGDAAASVCRALSSYISGNWEGDGGTSVERLVAGVANIGVLYRRGLSSSACDFLYTRLLDKWGRFKYQGEWKDMSPCVVHGTKESGGLGVPDRDGCVWVLEDKVPPAPSLTASLRFKEVDASLDAVRLLANRVQPMGWQLVREKDLVSALAKDSYDVSRAVQKLTDVVQSDEWARFWGHYSRIKQKISYSVKDVDRAVLEEFMFWSEEERHPQLEKYERQQDMVQYLPYLAREDGTPLSMSDLFGEMAKQAAIISKMDVAFDRMTLCNPLVSSAVQRWARDLVLCGVCGAWEACERARIAATTYGATFGFGF
jgi:hypothetical protein